MPKEAEVQFAALVQMYYDGSWDWNSHMRIKEGPQFMADAVELLEVEYNVKINKVVGK